MQRVCSRGKVSKVPVSVYRVRQIPGRACAPFCTRGFSGEFPRSFCPLAWPPNTGVSRQFSLLSPPSGGRSGWLWEVDYRVRSPWCVKAGQLQQVARTGWLADKVSLRMSHMFVPMLTDMFNHWFARGAIPGSITKGVITLLKKGGKHVWEDLDDYRPITLLNT